ncbi:FecR family protein [Asticcacaulis solisilvae]|uniref:FecR family protein n=1 Tax=Asticcacaulis solisilvae TaxID=1217274 RepID=UPI003FD6E048
MSPIDQLASDWVARRYSGRMDEAAEAAFQTWHDADPRHAGAYLRAEAAWVLLDRSQVLTHGEGGVEDVLSRPIEAPPVRALPEPTRRAVLMGTVAASIAALAGMAWFLRSRLSFETGRGELRKVPLADRSLAAINTDSRIDVAMSQNRRDIHLVKGEAWFEVAKNPDAPFVVSAGDIRVRAVGTAFSVRRHADGADVLVTEGVVETWSVRDPLKKTRLTAGDQAFVADAARVATAFEPDEVTRKLAWRERRIILREENLSDAVAEFNRYNEQQIVIADPSLASLKLVGGFDVDQPEDFARSVHAASSAPVSIRADRIIIGTQAGAG